jgi:hypothetical protein
MRTVGGREVPLPLVSQGEGRRRRVLRSHVASPASRQGSPLSRRCTTGSPAGLTRTSLLARTRGHGRWDVGAWRPGASGFARPLVPVFDTPLEPVNREMRRAPQGFPAAAVSTCPGHRPRASAAAAEETAAPARYATSRDMIQSLMPERQASLRCGTGRTQAKPISPDAGSPRLRARSATDRHRQPGPRPAMSAYERPAGPTTS